MSDVLVQNNFYEETLKMARNQAKELNLNLSIKYKKLLNDNEREILHKVNNSEMDSLL